MNFKKYQNLFLLVIFLMLLITFSCSDGFDSEDSEGNDVFFNLSSQKQQDHWLNSKNICSIGWDIHPYKECSKESFGVKSYKEARSEVCGVESEVPECNTCRHSRFGIENIYAIKKENISREYPPININIYAPYESGYFALKFQPGCIINGKPTRWKIIEVIPKQYDPLPSISNHCSKYISQIKEEFKKIFPDNIINVSFVSGDFKDVSTHQVFRNDMLQNVRNQKFQKVLSTRDFPSEKEFNRHIEWSGFENNIISLYPSCHYVLEINKTIYKEGKDCKICGSTPKKIYKLCRNPSHGVEKYNTQKSIECGVIKDKIIRSGINLSKKYVEKNEGEILGCKTCEDISFDPSDMNDEKNIEAVKQKRLCLNNNLNNTDEKDENTKFFITRELDRLRYYFDKEL